LVPAIRIERLRRVDVTLIGVVLNRLDPAGAAERSGCRRRDS